MEQIDIFIQLFNLVERHVVNYREDLTKHDYNSIKGDAKTPFIHISRKNGTYLARFAKTESYPKKGKKTPYLFGYATREHIINESIKALYFYLDSKPECIVFFDGKKIKEITKSQAISIYQRYVQQIKMSWETEEEKQTFLQIVKL